MLRKGMEAVLTVALELCWSKRRILEVYLNIAQFGPDIFGADAISRKIFGLPPSQLDGHRAALLISVLPNPHLYRAMPPTPNISQRAAAIQEQVRLLGGRAYLSGVIESQDAPRGLLKFTK
jgi:monofunctional biosynthetic peptidoglycan transglycosylase